MKILNYCTHRLIKGEDLNHHGTLFAGRSAEWFVESGFIAASALINPKYLICLKIHGMTFTNPVRLGESICLSSKIVLAGKTSLIAYISVSRTNQPDRKLVEGFITFVHVDENTRPKPHNIEIKAESEEDIILAQKAKILPKN